jgi:hypothetical protein
MTLPGISKHLKVLERCGLISRTRHSQFRPCHLEGETFHMIMVGRMIAVLPRSLVNRPRPACPACR